MDVRNLGRSWRESDRLESGERLSNFLRGRAHGVLWVDDSIGKKKEVIGQESERKTRRMKRMRKISKMSMEKGWLRERSTREDGRWELRESSRSVERA